MTPPPVQGIGPDGAYSDLALIFGDDGNQPFVTEPAIDSLADITEANLKSLLTNVDQSGVISSDFDGVAPELFAFQLTEISVDPNPVPLPAAGWLLPSGLGVRQLRGRARTDGALPAQSPRPKDACACAGGCSSEPSPLAAKPSVPK